MANEAFSNLTINGKTNINPKAATSDTDKFLVSDNKEVKYRTGTQLLSDLGITAGEIIDWTSDQGSTNIHTGNYTNTTYSEATGSAEGLMSVTHHDKLDGIEDNATADQGRNDIEALAIREVGILATGSISSSFGAIDNGADAITTTGTVTTGPIAAGSSAITTTGLITAGTSLVAGATLTASPAGDTAALQITQTLNAASGTNAGPAAEHYSALQMNITETDSAGFDSQNFINCEGAGAGTTEKFKVALDGNVTSAGTVTSTHGVCGGTRHFIHAGFNYGYTAGTKIYVPMIGTFESSSGASRNETLTFVAPYDGYLNQVIFRSEEACGSTIVGLHKSATGTEIPNTTAAMLSTVNMAADDTPYRFGLGQGVSSGANTFDAGDILAISFDPTNDANDTVCTIELIFDINEGL